MEKCPYCLAETRPGDNFCLNCGNRLTPATSSPAGQQAQSGIGDATLAAPDDWGMVAVPNQAPPVGVGAYNPAPAQMSNGWSDPNLMSTQVDASSSAATIQASVDRIDRPAHFILRSESGEELQTYTLDKPEITIGRAPQSDILLSKDKLTSRRHATVRYENGNYYLRDEGSANNTFLNGQQIETMTPRLLKDGDHIGIGEHELIFRAYTAIEDAPTISVPYNPDNDKTFRTPAEHNGVDDVDAFATRPVEEAAHAPQQVEQPVVQSAENPASAPAQPAEVTPAPEPSMPVPVQTSFPMAVNEAGTSTPVGASNQQTVRPVPPTATPVASARPSTPVADGADANLTFNHLTNVEQPSLPDMTALVAALSTLDGQVLALQEQFNATQEAMRQHDSEVAKTANQLRTGVRRVSERMDNAIADVARGRESLGWSELLQLMEDVMNNPRDIEYVTKLARKARELNKIFQIQQNVLNTMAECNSLLRSMIGEER